MRPRRGAFQPSLKCNDRIRQRRSGRKRNKINAEGKKPLGDDLFFRKTGYQGEPKPDREYGKLHRSGDPDEVSPAGVVRARKTGSNPDHSRYREARERSLKAWKENWPAFNLRHKSSGQQSGNRARKHRNRPLPRQFPIPAPRTKANRENLREKWQEERSHDYCNGIVTKNAGGKKYRSRHRPAQIARGQSAQLREVLNDIRERAHSSDLSGLPEANR